MFDSGTIGTALAKDVVGVCDLSPAAINAAIRAAMLADGLRVPVRLLYSEADVAADGQRPSAISRIVESAAPSSPVTARAVPADSIAEVLAAVRDAVVVIPCLGGNPVRERILGAPAERLIRLARAPVLVVKRTASCSYRSVLVAVDLREHSDRLLAAAAMFAPGSNMAVFHSLAPANDIGAPPDTDGRLGRRERVEQACAGMEVLLAVGRAASACPPEQARSMFPVFSFGSAAETILAGETAHHADLIVIGKRRRGMWAHFLLGGVTQRVLARCEADVLIVPMPPESREQLHEVGTGELGGDPDVRSRAAAS